MSVQVIGEQDPLRKLLWSAAEQFPSAEELGWEGSTHWFNENFD